MITTAIKSKEIIRPALPSYVVSMHCTGHLVDEIVNSPPLAPQNTDPYRDIPSSSTLLEE